MNRTALPNFAARGLPTVGAKPARWSWQNPALRLCLFFAAHVPLALLMANYPLVG
jgi:hypothetical protein